MVRAPLFDVPVHGVVAGVAFRSGEPTVKWRVAVVDQRVPFLFPMDSFRGFGPEFFRIGQRAIVDFIKLTDSVLLVAATQTFVISVLLFRRL